MNKLRTTLHTPSYVQPDPVEMTQVGKKRKRSKRGRTRAIWILPLKERIKIAEVEARELQDTFCVGTEEEHHLTAPAANVVKKTFAAISIESWRRNEVRTNNLDESNGVSGGPVLVDRYTTATNPETGTALWGNKTRGKGGILSQEEVWKKWGLERRKVTPKRDTTRSSVARGVVWGIQLPKLRVSLSQ